MKETILEEAVRTVLQVISYGGDSVTLKKLEKIGVMQAGELREDIDDGHCEVLGRTIGELAKSLRWKSLISRD